MRLLNSDKLTYTADELKKQGMVPGVDLARVAADSPASAAGEPNAKPGGPLRTPDSVAEEPVRAALAGSPPAGHDVSSWLAAGHSKPRRLDRLRAVFQAHQKLKVCEVVGILGVSRSTASRYLAELEKQGVIARVGPSSSTSMQYFEPTPGRTGDREDP